MTAPAAISGPTNGDIASATHGCWLPLREAVREVGSLEHLYRLARDGKLPSRDDADGRIEVWITDADRSDAALAGSLEARLARDGTLPSRPEATGSVEPSVASEQVTSAISERIGMLLAPLVEGYERYVELARENGALSERVASLEHELHALRGAAMADGQALERMESRLQALEDVNLAMKQLFAGRREQ